MSGRRSISYQTVTPHSGQKWWRPQKPSSEPRAKLRDGPATATCAAA
jgi:hypothetical protein